MDLFPLPPRERLPHPASLNQITSGLPERFRDPPSPSLEAANKQKPVPIQNVEPKDRSEDDNYFDLRAEFEASTNYVHPQKSLRVTEENAHVLSRKENAHILSLLKHDDELFSRAKACVSSLTSPHTHSKVDASSEYRLDVNTTQGRSSNGFVFSSPFPTPSVEAGTPPPSYQPHRATEESIARANALKSLSKLKGNNLLQPRESNSPLAPTVSSTPTSGSFPSPSYRSTSCLSPAHANVWPASTVGRGHQLHSNGSHTVSNQSEFGTDQFGIFPPREIVRRQSYQQLVTNLGGAQQQQPQSNSRHSAYNQSEFRTDHSSTNPPHRHAVGPGQPSPQAVQNANHLRPLDPLSADSLAPQLLQYLDDTVILQNHHQPIANLEKQRHSGNLMEHRPDLFDFDLPTQHTRSARRDPDLIPSSNQRLHSAEFTRTASPNMPALVRDESESDEPQSMSDLITSTIAATVEALLEKRLFKTTKYQQSQQQQLSRFRVQSPQNIGQSVATHRVRHDPVDCHQTAYHPTTVQQSLSTRNNQSEFEQLTSHPIGGPNHQSYPDSSDLYSRQARPHGLLMQRNPQFTGNLENRHRLDSELALGHAISNDDPQQPTMSRYNYLANPESGQAPRHTFSNYEQQ